ncbi:MAG TPA: 3-hydroxyacyl-CoA dehydrogenase NAD-binding domain-containing protein [Burkholderiaceae bacterium]|nr:3-hydroxyacyl-CoA dehydrogenase NAD-binding domain-containing protein [Burkholderiaceae bacterium]
MTQAQYRQDGEIAVVTMDNPPVNGLGFDLRSGIDAGVRRALGDPSVKAIVLTGTARAFSGGADIREFNSPKSTATPNLNDLINLIENADKPVIAAVGGLALGGGNELALGCHYRVCAPGTMIGLPEVNLGLLPGAGGTQRLPRLIGAAKALDMIVSGNPIRAEEAVKLGYGSKVVEGDLVEGAIAFAREVVASGSARPKIRDRSVDPASMPGGVDAFFAQAREHVAKTYRGFPAPMKNLECVEAAVKKPFDEGIKVERTLFEGLVEGTESKAMRHAFFAERAAAKIPDVPDDTPTRPIKSAAVIGAGTMGGGITMNFLNAGIPVTLLETKQEALDRGVATIRRNYEATAKKGRMTAEQVEQRMAMVRPTLSYADLAQADIVVEAVFEDMDVKKTVFEQLDATMNPGAILASNTSTLDVDRIASFTKRPQDVIGTHFFSPANVMRLLEVVRGKATGKDVLATTMQLAKKIKKVGVVSGVCDGFIGNRMIEQYSRQAGFLLEEGCTPQQVDGAIERWGFAMGPFRMGDLAGNDVGWYIRKRRYQEKPHLRYSRTADLLCEMGRFGQKTSAGWYDYKAGDRTAHPSPVVEKMLTEERARLGVAPRQVSDEEIVHRLLFALVNEAAYILEEGIALRASDIDIIYLTGYGFPRYRGGPMFYADTVGLPKVVEIMKGFAANPNADPTFWTPAPLLAKLAADGKRFNG